MATELLAISEDYLAEFIYFLRRALKTCPPLSTRLQATLMNWCDEEEAYLVGFRGPEEGVYREPEEEEGSKTDDEPIRCGTFNARLQARFAAERAQRVPEWVRFGQALRAARIQLTLTLLMAADRAGLQPADYSAIEQGRACPPKDAGDLLAALGIPAGSPSWHRLCRLAEDCH